MRHLCTQWVLLKEGHLELRKPQSFPSSKRDALSSQAVYYSTILKKIILNKKLAVITFIRYAEILENQGESHANTI